MREKEKEKWAKICVPELVSSEESEGEVMVVKNLPWRSHTCKDFFKMLDDKGNESKSDQAKRQTKRRIVGTDSDRNRPSLLVVPSWSLN